MWLRYARLYATLTDLKQGGGMCIFAFEAPLRISVLMCLLILYKAY